jgi:FkbM family methyltransferase
MNTLTSLKHEQIEFLARPGSSDEKTFAEVIVKRAYEKNYFKILPGEKWLDLGGNVGAFAVRAASLGATVDIYEPDPFNCQMIKRNLEANNVQAAIHQVAVVHDDQNQAILNLWPQGQSWRNSIVRNKRGTSPLAVKCLNLYSILTQPLCIKMDIEGSEIPLLLNWPEQTPVQKLVFEWSFDVDKKTSTLRTAIARLSKDFPNIKVTSQIYKIESWDFFPPATMIFCWK